VFRLAEACISLAKYPADVIPQILVRPTSYDDQVQYCFCAFTSFGFNSKFTVPRICNLPERCRASHILCRFADSRSLPRYFSVIDHKSSGRVTTHFISSFLFLAHLMPERSVNFKEFSLTLLFCPFLFSFRTSGPEFFLFKSAMISTGPGRLKPVPRAEASGQELPIAFAQD
jgi:hypothetical protein